jgi:hypothetical protein
VTRDEKVGHNVVLLLAMVAIGALAVHRAGVRRPRASVAG